MSSSQEKPVYSDSDYDSDSDSDSGTEAQYGMTRKKLELYRKQVQESEGFDVDDVCAFMMLGQIRPILDIQGDEDANKSVLAAIDEFNRRKFKNTVLEFEELDMATYQLVAGILFRLTFKAKNIAKGGESLTYQAIVLSGIDKQHEVLSFRRKPSGSQKEEWIFQKRLCG